VQEQCCKYCAKQDEIAVVTLPAKVRIEVQPLDSIIQQGAATHIAKARIEMCSHCSSRGEYRGAAMESAKGPKVVEPHRRKKRCGHRFSGCGT